MVTGATLKPVSGGEMIDARPILQRIDSGAFAHAEAARDALYAAIQEELARCDLDGLVLRSASQEHPCWVKVECWLPIDGRLLTERGSAIIRIQPKSFHRFEVEYTVEYTSRGKTKTESRLWKFAQPQVSRLLNYLVKSGPKMRFAGLRLRRSGLDFWNPKNKVDALKADWAARAAGVLFFLGIVTVQIGIGVVFLVIAGIIAIVLMSAKRSSAAAADR